MNTETVIWIVIAIVGGRMLQLYLTYPQSMAFNAKVRTLRTSGKVSVGLGGKRYRGGRAFVAIAVDDTDVVRDAMTLQGWTTFSRGKPLPAVIGTSVKRLIGDRDVPGLTAPQRLAARQAAELYRASPPPTATTRTGSKPREGAVAD